MFYLTREQLPFFLPLGFIGVYRWFFFLIRIIAWCLYRPHRPRTRPRYKSSRDVTIIVPTIDSGEEIKLAVRSWLKSDPNEIIFVTIPKAEQDLLRLAREVDPDSRKIRVITIPRPNKRNQMVAGINHTRTEIIVFCDDDVIWPPTMLAYLLAPFEDRQMGGVGTSQTVMAVNKRWTIWEILSAYRISMRNIEITATTYIDGGVCCLSGRTAAYRTKILLDPDFQWKFTHEFWLGRFHQHSGDDKFLTRWLHAHQWKTWIQACQEAELSSTFKDNWRFLLQLLRWTRNTWRSDMRSLFFERHVWFRHPFVAFSMLDKMFNPFTLLAGPVTVVYLCVRGGEQLPIWVVIVSYVTWLLVTRLLKYMPHFVKRPQDIFTLPIWIVFNVYFALMKLYCLFTLHITDWGTRTGADHNTKASEKETMDIYTPHWQDPDWRQKDVDDDKDPKAHEGRPRSSETFSFSLPIEPIPAAGAHNVLQIQQSELRTTTVVDELPNATPAARRPSLIGVTRMLSNARYLVVPWRGQDTPPSVPVTVVSSTQSLENGVFEAANLVGGIQSEAASEKSNLARM